MRSPHGWIKTAGRGSAYYIPHSGFWIVRNGSTWRLFRMENKSLGRERKDHGAFPTLTAAAEFYRTEVAS